MKVLLCCAVVFWSVAVYGQDQKDAQTQLVLRDYYTLPWTVQRSVVTAAALHGDTENDTAAKLLAAQLDITLSDVTAGNIVEVLGRNLSDFVTVPKRGQDILFIEVDPDENRSDVLRAYWGPLTHQPPVGKTVGDWLGDDAAAIERYVATTVHVNFQNREMTYKAMYLFAKDQRPALIADIMIEATRYSSFKQSFVPDVLLHSKERDNAIVRNWFESHTVDDASCTESELCCAGNRCGIRRSDLKRQLSEPIREPNQPIAFRGAWIGRTVGESFPRR